MTKLLATGSTRILDDGADASLAKNVTADHNRAMLESANVASTPSEALPAKTRRPLKLSTVSHTLDDETALRLRHFAFRERISESAVIEQSLRELFEEGDDSQLGRRLRKLGAGLRRKS